MKYTKAAQSIYWEYNNLSQDVEARKLPSFKAYVLINKLLREYKSLTPEEQELVDVWFKKLNVIAHKWDEPFNLVEEEIKVRKAISTTNSKIHKDALHVLLKLKKRKNDFRKEIKVSLQDELEAETINQEMLKVYPPSVRNSLDRQLLNATGESISLGKQLKRRVGRFTNV